MEILAWSSSFRSTPKQPDEAMRVLEGKAFELDVNLEVVQPLTARQLSFACLYLASANCDPLSNILLWMQYFIWTELTVQQAWERRKQPTDIAIQLLFKSAASTSKFMLTLQKVRDRLVDSNERE
ncbi:hypothetical protein YC2023_008107 [Brassica napus]